MVVATQTAIKKLQTHLTKAGYTGTVEIGEPQKPPPGWHASITLLSFGPKPDEETSLDKSIERRVVTISIRRPVLAGTPEETELKMDEIFTNLHAALTANFQLDGSLRFMEMTTVDFQYEQIPTGGAEYRVGRMTVPMIIDDSATFAA